MNLLEITPESGEKTAGDWNPGEVQPEDADNNVGD